MGGRPGRFVVILRSVEGSRVWKVRGHSALFLGGRPGRFVVILRSLFRSPPSRTATVTIVVGQVDPIFDGRDHAGS